MCGAPLFCLDFFRNGLLCLDLYCLVRFSAVMSRVVLSRRVVFFNNTQTEHTEIWKYTFCAYLVKKTTC